MNTFDGSPYNMTDGYWGAFGGPCYWQTFKWSGTNVFERSHDGNGYWKYDKVWDDTIKEWRDITSEEHTKLPTGKKYPTLEEWKESRRNYYYGDRSKCLEYIDYAERQQ